MRALIVDGCKTTRRLLGIYLKSIGFEVVFAENGLDALEKLLDADINLILVELYLPYMDGIEFVKTVKTNPLSVDIPILMVTTEGDREKKEMAIRAGVDGYIVKPVTADLLLRHIEDVLKTKPI
jgi:two-component system chemotaxis response regulator CheY